MDFPKVKKRISDFISSEEGKISKQSLLSMGAFLGSAGIGAAILAHDASAQAHTSGPFGHVSHANCPSGGESNCPGSPGDCQPVNDDALNGHNAYDENGTQIYFGTKACSDDNRVFHFNGTKFSYTGEKLVSKHNHHGSHNSY